MNHDLREEAWHAILTRDTAFDGQWYYGVTTTGIVCRPSCPSPTPRREHVRIFPNLEEALRSGFRPCKRCRPGQESRSQGTLSGPSSSE